MRLQFCRSMTAVSLLTSMLLAPLGIAQPDEKVVPSSSDAGSSKKPQGLDQAPLSFEPPSTAQDADTRLTLDDRVYACACGCGVFEVGTSTMLPQGPGGMVWLEYDYQDQNRNWSGSSRAPAADNDDKEIRTTFLTLGLQYLFNRSWGFQVQVPYDLRHFETVGGASGSDTVDVNWGSLGDIRVEGIYTGFFPDLSAGVTFGLKLPTGSYRHNDAYDDVDRDTQIGTGSWDFLLGGFYRSAFAEGSSWNWFAQVSSDLPFTSKASYRPGFEVDGAIGLYYTGITVKGVGIVPIGQVIVSERTSDGGDNAADPVASGYQRILLSPGVEIDFHPIRLYADVEFPVYEHVTGNQLVAPALFKAIISVSF